MKKNLWVKLISVILIVASMVTLVACDSAEDFNESADTTIKNLGTYVKHVHLRDSDDKDTYNLIGEGNMPVADMIRAWRSSIHSGFHSREIKPS